MESLPSTLISETKVTGNLIFSLVAILITCINANVVARADGSSGVALGRQELNTRRRDGADFDQERHGILAESVDERLLPKWIRDCQ
jgi:hypothetical protein